MRLSLASTLRNRTRQTTKDARLLNAIAEQKGGRTRVIKRPSLVQTFEAINVGAGLGLYNWTTPTTEEVVAITGDVLSYGLTSVVRRLKFTTQPVNWKLDTAMSPSVVVAAQDAFGNTKTGYTGTVTIALSANPSGGTLSGTLSVAAVAGVATFSNLKLDKVGGGYSLKATATDLKQKVSSVFKIVSNLSFTIQPAGEPVDTVMETVEVSVQDSAGATVTGYTGNITLAIGYNGGIARAGTLSGTLTVAAVNGVASFTNLSIDEAGEYTLSASASGGLANVTSSFFDIGPYTLTIKTNTSDYNVRASFVIKYGTPPASVPLRVRVRVNSGIVVSASAAAAAMTWGEPWGEPWTGTPTFTLVNNGTIKGVSGAGGNGMTVTLGIGAHNGSAGGAGGDAIDVSGSTVSITNASGFIYGGAGGGGAGGAYQPGYPASTRGFGGGGGGYGFGGSVVGNYTGSAMTGGGWSGSDGANGSGTTGGAGASGVPAVGTAAAGAGGDGGADYATAGTSGATATADAAADAGWLGTGKYAGYSGGAAGKAINLTGGTANFVSGGTSPNVKGAVS